MELYIQDNGKMECVMEGELNYGKMVLIMKVIGDLIVQMERVD